jgi:hypothetical protein
VVEFALVLPLLLYVVLAMLSGLFFVVQSSTVVEAAQTGARTAAGTVASEGVNGTSDLQEGALAAASELSSVPGVHVSTAWPGNGACPGTPTGGGDLLVCARYGLGAATGTQVIVLSITGQLSPLAPVLPALGVNDQAVVHSLGFQS